MRSRVACAGLAAIALLTPSSSAAAGNLPLPFSGGLAARIIQGYNGGSHQGRSGYALDLVLVGAETSGAEVLSPVDASVAWAFPPGSGNGCIGMSMRDGGYSVTLCHVMFHRAYRAGECIGRGESLGTVGAAGRVGNNGTPHVHLELHRGAGARSPVPFTAETMLLEGLDLPAGGGSNEHASRAVGGSSNASPAPAFAPAVAPAPAAAASRAALAPAPAPRPAPAPEAAPARAPAPAPRVEAEPAARVAAARGNRLPDAVVRGTDSCLSVRSKPSVDASVVECLPDGTEVALTASAEQAGAYLWRQVENLGWVASDFLRRTRGIVSGTDSCLNVRQTPSTAALVVGCLPEGTSIGILEGPTEDWVRVEPSAQAKEGGWVSAPFLR